MYPKACSDVVHQYHCSTATWPHAAVCVELASVSDQVHDLRIHCMPKYPTVCFDVMHQSITQPQYNGNARMNAGQHASDVVHQKQLLNSRYAYSVQV
jgi:hypothetical protein